MIVGVDPARVVELGLTAQQVEQKVSQALTDILNTHCDIRSIHRWVDGTLEIIVDGGLAVAPYYIRDGLVVDDAPQGNARNRIKICGYQHYCQEGCGCHCAKDQGLLSPDVGPNAVHVPCS